MIDMSPAINNRLDRIAEILPDHERPCWLPGCPENEVGALRDHDAIVLDPKVQP